MTQKIVAVICPPLDKIPGGKLPSYLTAGKRYEVLQAGPIAFVFTHNLGERHIGFWKKCSDLNGTDWIPVYADGCQDCLPGPGGVIPVKAGGACVTCGRVVGAQSNITDNPRHLTSQESSALKSALIASADVLDEGFDAEDDRPVGSIGITDAPTWADVGPGLLEAAKELILAEDCGAPESDPIHQNIWSKLRAAIAAAEKVESHE